MIHFFVRRYNDIDHMTPIMYRLLKENEVSFCLWCLNPFYDLKGDKRLKFLQKQKAFPMDFVYSGLAPTKAHWVMAKFLKWAPWVMKLKFLGLLPLWSWVYEKYCRNRLFALTYFRKFFSHFESSLIVVDWQKPKQFNILHLINAAKEEALPIVAVPHGMNLATNKLITWSAFQKGEDTNYGKAYGQFDLNLVESENYKKRLLQGGLPESKIKVIGSPRFCKDWQKIYDPLMIRKRRNLKKHPHKLRVVYMDHSPNYRLHPDRVEMAIKSIAELPYVDLVIKPTTGGMFVPKGEGEDSSYCESLKTWVKKGEKYTSPTLVHWAQVVISTISSIALEVLFQKKVLLFPKYFQENTMLFEEHGACWMVQNQGELLGALERVYKEPDYSPYPDKKVDAFFNDVIYGGQSDRDVLGEYVTTLKELEIKK